MNRSLRVAIIRNLISIIIVVSLCVFYTYQKGNKFIWIFLPISLIPLVITIWDYQIQQKEVKNEELKRDKKVDLPKIGEKDKK